MASKPLKRTGFAQGAFVQNSAKKEEVGTMRVLKDGRKFRYARAGSSALAAGKLAIAADVAADVMDEATTIIAAIGQMQFAETITSATYAEDYFAGGFLQINDGTGEGHQYKIDSSTAVAATAITLSLAEPIRVATVVTTSLFSIIHSPYMAVVESATKEQLPVGVTPIVVTATYYYWIQTSGVACVLSANTDAIGKPLFQSTSTAGAVSGADVASYYPQVGIVLGTAGIVGDYKPVMLTLE